MWHGKVANMIVQHKVSPKMIGDTMNPAGFHLKSNNRCFCQRSLAGEKWLDDNLVLTFSEHDYPHLCFQKCG